MSDTNTINVGNYPSSNRVPGVFAAIDASKANTAQTVQRSMILAQKLPTGTAPVSIPVLVPSPQQATVLFGAGSEASCAVERYLALDPTAELWVTPLVNEVGSAAGAAEVTLTGTATANAILPLYVDGQLFAVGVNVGDDETAIATNAKTAFNAYRTPAGNTMPEIATSAAGVLTLTARNTGSVGNTFDVRLSYGGTKNGEGPPGTTNVPGVTAVITAPTGGTTDPDLTIPLSNFPEKPFDFIFNPYANVSAMAEVSGFLNDATGQWSYSTQLFGGAFSALGGTLNTRTAFSTGLNDQHTSMIGAYNSPSPDWQWGIDYMAASAVSLKADPTLPIGGLTSGVALNVRPPPDQDVDTFGERQVLLNDGMSTYKVDDAGVVHVDRAITTYQTNASGGPDNSYLNLNVPYQLMAYVRVLETMIGTQFNRSKLVADGSRIPPGSKMVTSQTILFSVVAQYEQICTIGLPGAPVGLVQNPQAFAKGAAAENAGGGLVKLLLPVQLGGQLIAVAISVAFSQP